GVVDPGENYAIEVHQYLDADFSGTSGSCQSPGIGSQALSAFTDWARAQGVRAFLGEFAGGNDATCQAAVTDMVGFVEANDDVWMGWTWWAAGPQWGEYIFTIEPDGPTDRPQMDWLEPF